MKKIFLFLSALITLGCIVSEINAQTYTIGGTTNYNTSTQFPTVYSRQYASTRQQILILASELTNAGATAGNITSIAFDVYAANSSGPLPNYTIKMKHTSTGAILTFDNSGLTQVYTIGNYYPSSGWNTHTFQTQFAWNGSSNILIDICNTLTTTATTNYNASVYFTNTPGQTNVIAVDNSTNQCGGTPVYVYVYMRPTVRFTISGALPSCANLTSPANGATGLPINTTLAWTNGGNTSSYDVYFGTNPTPPFIQNQTSLTHNPGVLLGNTTYYWKIVARNSYGASTGCVTRSFTTGSDCPSSLLPVNGDTNLAINQTLSWGSVPLTSKYYVYFGTSPTPPLLDSTTNTTYAVSDLLGHTTYYWRIAPKNSLGLVAGCSVSTFTTRKINHWFIKTSGNDMSSGDCWNNAKSDLSALLFNVTAGDSIHVAAGNYLPTRDKLNNLTPSDLRDYCFTVNPGIKLIGGYPSGASGTDLPSSLQVPMNPAVNLTTLSGNIGTNDSLDNCYHVVWVVSGSGAPAVIDGFKITLGYANGASAQTRHRGGGIYAAGGKVTIINDLFTRNYTLTTTGNSGGGIYSNACDILIKNSTFDKNGSTTGCAIYAYSGKLTINGSTIINSINSAAVYSASTNILIVDNCTMWNNYYSSDLGINTTGSTVPLITNSTLGGIYIYGGTPPSVNNTICAALNGTGSTFRYSIVNNMTGADYYDGTGIKTTVPGISNWISNPAFNGGTTKTCLLTTYNYQNPAVGRGNPAYAGLVDQRGIIRSNLPCVGAVEVPYFRSSDILINDTTIYMGNNVTLTAHSATVSNPVFEWFSDASLTVHVYTGSSYTTPVLNSNYYYYLTVHNSSVFNNPPAAAKKVIVQVVQKPIITRQPVTTIKCLSDSACLSVASYGQGLSYQWVKNNIDLTGQTNDTLKITHIQYADSGYYFCRVTNAYGTTNSDTVKLDVRTIPGAASVINGLTSICAGLNGTLYNTPVIADVDTYSWSLPSGATGTSITNSIMVSFTALAQSGNITVYGINQCGSGAPYSSFIAVGNFAPSAAGAITGITNVCAGQNNVTYSISAVPNANSYIWTLPPGATGTSTTNSITINYGVTAVSGNISVKGTNACGDGAASTLYIDVNTTLPVSISVVANPGNSICTGTNVSFTATPVNGGSSPTYQWQVNSVNIPGATNSNYSTASLTNGNVVRCVLTTNGEPCLTGSPAISNTITMIVNSNPTTPVVTIVGADLHSSASTGNQWYYNNVLIAGATGQSHTPAQNGNYYTIVTTNGCSSQPSNTINFGYTGTHWFVKVNGDDGLSGNCWNNAKKDLSQVLLAASTDDTIHVAAGTYLSTRDSVNNTLPTDVRDYCFTFRQSMTLLGGYPSTAAGGSWQISIQVPRIPSVNQTILSGNIGTNDSADNSYHVVRILSGNIDTSMIDGITISYGYSNTIGGCSGGGLYCNHGNVRISNCVVRQNRASSGGGVYIHLMVTPLLIIQL